MLAGLLWPESLKATARGNLRQLLRRLRDGVGAELIAGDDQLFLTDGVSVDAVQLELDAFAGDDAAVSTWVISTAFSEFGPVIYFQSRFQIG